MEAKKLKITIPEDQEIDWQESAKQEKIVFKKKNTKPRSWEEYERMVLKDMGYKDSSTDTISITFPGLFTKVSDYKFLQEHTAFIKLCMLRQAWIGDWKPRNPGFLIMLDVKRDIMVSRGLCYGPLTFPTKEMAVDFMNTFKDLLETAKPLI